MERLRKKQLVKLRHCQIPGRLVQPSSPIPVGPAMLHPLQDPFIVLLSKIIPQVSHLLQFIHSLAVALVTMQGVLENLLEQISLFIHLLCSWYESPRLLLCFCAPQGTKVINIPGITAEKYSGVLKSPQVKPTKKPQTIPPKLKSDSNQ